MESLHLLNDTFPQGKRVLLRVDFNVPLDKNGIILDSRRILNHLPTIQFLLAKDSKLVLLAHLGQPDGRNVPAYSFSHILPQLNNLLGLNIQLQTLELYQPTNDGITLLENLRFHFGEEANADLFIQEIAKLGDMYVNDAFSVSHRAHASIIGLPKLLPSFAGLALAREVENLNTLLHQPPKPYTLIIGGKKVSDKLGVLEHLLPLVDTVLIGGACANTFVKAKGEDIKSSYFEPEMVKTCQILLASSAGTKILLPVDYREGDRGFLDIGPQTIKQFCQVIKNSQTVVWAGPLGRYEDARFNKGNEAILKTIASSGTKSVIGGGDTLAALRNFPGFEKISFISLGGSAMLEFLAKGTLVGIEALRNSE